MAAHSKAFSAVFPIIIKKHMGTMLILLHKRENTGFMDDMWDIAASGHVDENETATQAIIRECSEEIGIVVRTGDLEFAHVSHRVNLNGEQAYFYLYFYVHAFTGTPTILEPNKCSDLQWFDTEHLPVNMIGFHKTVLEYIFSSRYYSEQLF